MLLNEIRPSQATTEADSVHDWILGAVENRPKMGRFNPLTRLLVHSLASSL